jgi:hypothetical protein
VVLAAAVAAQLGLAASAQQAGGSLYRWVDKDGHVHYGDQPGAADARRLNADASASGGDDAATAAQTAAAAKQAEQCKQKQEQLDTYAKASTITETDALGNKHEYSADEKTQLMDKTRQYLNQNCASSSSSGGQ